MTPPFATSRARGTCKPRRIVLAMLLAAAALPSARTLHAVDVRTVALTGDAAPGTAFNYDGFDSPILNNFNQVAFIAGIDNGSSGLWSEGSGSLAKVALEGEAAPGTALNYGTFGDTNIRVYLNDAGQTAFQQRLSDFNTGGLFSETGVGNAVQKVAVGGDPAPGTNDPARVFQPFFGTTGGFNDSGQSTFYGSMPPTPSPPGNFPSNGVWSQGTGPVSKLAEVADPAPGVGAVFLDFGTPAINNSGHAAFVGQYTLGNAGKGVWSDSSGVLSRIVSTGDAAPGGGTFSILFSNTTAINDNDDIVFSANLNGGTVPDGIWVSRGGGIDKVAVEGDLAPGGGGATFRTAGTGIEPAILGLDDNGGAAFTAYLSDGRRGLFTEGFGPLDAVALSGDSAPDTGGLTYLNVVRWAINGNGEAAFLAQLSDFSDAIFGQDEFGALHRIVGDGDMLEVAPGDFRQIEFLTFQGLDGSAFGHLNNVSSGFGDDGRIAFEASFLDGSTGVFVTSVLPEPSTLLLLVVGSIALLWRFRPTSHRL